MKLRTQPSYWFYSLINIYLWFTTPYINSSMIIIYSICIYIGIKYLEMLFLISIVVCMTKIFKPNGLERLIWDSESWGQWHNFWRFFIQIWCLARLCFIKKCLFLKAWWICCKKFQRTNVELWDISGPFGRQGHDDSDVYHSVNGKHCSR